MLHTLCAVPRSTARAIFDAMAVNKRYFMYIDGRSQHKGENAFKAHYMEDMKEAHNIFGDLIAYVTLWCYHVLFSPGLQLDVVWAVIHDSSGSSCILYCVCVCEGVCVCIRL